MNCYGQHLREARRRLVELNRQMDLLLRDIAMETTCTRYPGFGKTLQIISTSITATLRHARELSKAPEEPLHVRFLVHLPSSNQDDPVASDSEQSGSEEPTSEPPPDSSDFEWEMRQLIEEVEDLSSLILHVAEIAFAHCRYFNRNPTSFFTSLNRAHAVVIRERHYLFELLPATSQVEFLIEQGPLPEFTV
jgi:hypothetical protein